MLDHCASNKELHGIEPRVAAETCRCQQQRALMLNSGLGLLEITAEPSAGITALSTVSQGLYARIYFAVQP